MRVLPFLFLTMLGTGLVVGQNFVNEGNVIERKPVPAEVMANAVKAVQALGNDTMAGKFDDVLAKLYPRFRKRAAKRLGGEAALNELFVSKKQELARSGATTVSFIAEPALHGFEIPEFKEWLVFVPTTKQVRVINPNTGEALRIEVRSYQVAIRKKDDGASWSFLEGLHLDSRELRALFPSIPATAEELGLPKEKLRQLR